MNVIYLVYRYFKYNLPPKLMFVQRQSSYQFLHQYLEKLVLGDHSTLPTYLTPEEEGHLFSKLQDLHASRGIDLKGVWGLLSLQFQNRSGAWLMAMYYNSNIVKEKSFEKKRFLKQLEHLINPQITKQHVFKLLDLLKIDPNHFTNCYQQWLQKEYLPQQKQIQSKLKKPIFHDISQLPIFDQNQYESNPDTVLYQDLADAFQQSELKTIYHNYSFQESSPSSQSPEKLKQKAEESDDEITVSLGIKRKVYNRDAIPYQRKKRGKRPKKKNIIRQKMQQKLKQISNKKQLIFSAKRQRCKLLRNKQYDQIFYLDNSETPVKNNRAKYDEEKLKRRGKSNAINNDQKLTYHSMENQDSVSSQSDNGFNLFEDYQSVNEEEQRNEKKLKKLRKNNQFEFELGLGKQKLIFNEQQETLQNLSVRKIDFKGYQRIDEEEPHFAIDEYLREVKCMNLSDLKKQIVRLSNQCREIYSYSSQINKLSQERIQEIQVIIRSLCLMSYQPFQQFKSAYFQPIIVFWCVKHLSKIITKTIQLLYTPTSNDIANISNQCFFFTHLQQYQLPTIQPYVYKALSIILQDLSGGKRQPVSSFIYFQKTSLVLQKVLQIRIKQKDYIFSILIAMLMVDIGWIKPNFPSQNSQEQKKFTQNIKNCLTLKIHNSNKSQFLGLSMKINMLYKQKVTKQDKQKMEDLACKLNLCENQSEQLFINFKSFYENFIYHNPNNNFKSMLNYIVLTNKFNESCKKFQKQENNFNFQNFFVAIFSAVLEFPSFHHDITLRQMLKQYRSIDFERKIDEHLMYKLLQILIQAYSIKTQNHKDHLVLLQSKQSCQKDQVLSEIKREICNYLKLIWQKLLISYSDKNKKYMNLLQYFFLRFFSNDSLKQYLSHALFSHQLLFDICIPFLTQNIKRLGDRELINKIIQNLGQFKNMEIIVRGKDWDMEIQDPEEEFQRLLITQQNKKKLKQYYINFVQHKMQNLNLKHIFNVITIDQMNEPEQKNYYELVGMIACLHNLNPFAHSSVNKGHCFDIVRKQHLAKMRIVNNERGSIYQTNQLYLQFLKGLLKMMEILKEMHVDKKLDKSNQELILDIIFQNLYYHSARALLYEMRVLKGFHGSGLHFSSPALSKIGRIEEVNRICSIIEQTPKMEIQNSVNRKFGTYLQYWTTLNQIYLQKQWKTKRADLILMLVQIFTFLLRFKASTQLINKYSTYFIIRDSNYNHNNFLKTVDVRHRNGAQTVLHLFRNIFEREKIALYQTYHHYLHFIVNLEIKQVRFDRIDALFMALKADVSPFSSGLVKQLCNNVLVYLTDKEKQVAITKYFLSLFKSYEQYSSIFTTLFHEKERQIQNIIRTTKQFKNYNSLQEVIRRYIVFSENCDFKGLYFVLEDRVRRCVRFGILSDKKLLERQIELINTILSTLQKKHQNDEIVEQYRRLLKNLVQF